MSGPTDSDIPGPLAMAAALTIGVALAFVLFGCPEPMGRCDHLPEDLVDVCEASGGDVDEFGWPETENPE